MKVKDISTTVWEHNGETFALVQMTLPKVLLKKKNNGVVEKDSRKEISSEINNTISKVDFFPNENFDQPKKQKTLEEVLAPYMHHPYKLY